MLCLGQIDIKIKIISNQGVVLSRSISQRLVMIGDYVKLTSGSYETIGQVPNFLMPVYVST